jgi:hypothetical protein
VTRDAHRLRAVPDVSGPSTFEEVLDYMDTVHDGWHKQAACNDGTGTNVDVFFPSGWAGKRTTHKQAVALCDTCRVKSQCAEQGRMEPAGVWAGVARDRTKSSAGHGTLGLLRREGGWWTAKRIAAARQVTERTVYRQLGALRADGLVEQQKQDDHRPTLYRAVPKGRA